MATDLACNKMISLRQALEFKSDMLCSFARLMVTILLVIEVDAC